MGRLRYTIIVCYEWLYMHTTGRPYTEIVRDSWDNPKTRIGWIIGIFTIGYVLGHILW